MVDAKRLEIENCFLRSEDDGKEVDAVERFSAPEDISGSASLWPPG